MDFYDKERCHERNKSTKISCCKCCGLHRHGANRILAAGVHGVLSGPALERIEASKLELVLFTNTTPVEEKLARCSKLKAFSVARLLGEAILRIHENSSVSSLFV